MNAIYDKARQSLWLSWLLDNPLLVREMRRRMRGRLFSWSLIGYLAALGGVSIVIMFASYPMTFGDQSLREIIQRVNRIGKTLYWGMCFVEGFIALFIAPMLTAGLATQEKEKDTFDFLRVTTLKSRTFVVGCLLTTACFLLLIFSCTLPILGLTFIFGGVSMADILGFNLFIFLAAMAISAWGVFNSTGYKRSRSVQGSLVVILFIGFFFGSSIVPFFTTRLISPFSAAVGGTWLDSASVVVPFVLAITVFAVAAARRLYDPNNRLFNYKQYSVFMAIAMAAIGGTLVYRMSDWSYAPLNPAQITGYLSIYFFVGYFLIAAAILIFSSGRIEKGDEVWNIRHTRPAFRIVHEQYLVYAAYIALWLWTASAMGAAYDPGKFTSRLPAAIPLSLASLATVIAAARFSNYFWEGRNRAMIVGLLALVVIWGVIPGIGYAIWEFAGGTKALGKSLFAFVGYVGTCASPVPCFVQIWDDKWSYEDLLLPILAQVAFAALFSLPALSRRLRENIRVSYDWWSSIGLPSPQPAESNPA